jgi:hypothetical protein
VICRHRSRDGLRLIHSPRKKTVAILCNIPLDMPVDDLVTWRELVGDGRLARALEVCEENGWEALPLAPGELVRLFPELWETCVSSRSVIDGSVYQ